MFHQRTYYYFLQKWNTWWKAYNIERLVGFNSSQKIKILKQYMYIYIYAFNLQMQVVSSVAKPNETNLLHQTEWSLLLHQLWHVVYSSSAIHLFLSAIMGHTLLFPPAAVLGNLKPGDYQTILYWDTDFIRVFIIKTSI